MDWGGSDTDTSSTDSEGEKVGGFGYSLEYFLKKWVELHVVYIARGGMNIGRDSTVFAECEAWDWPVCICECMCVCVCVYMCMCTCMCEDVTFSV